MRRVRIPHDLNGSDRFMLGLTVPGMAVLLFGFLAAYAALRSGLPLALRVVAGVLLATAAVAGAWIRPGNRSLLHWIQAAIEFKLSERGRTPSGSVQSQRTAILSILSTVQGDHDADGSTPEPDPDVIELPGTSAPAAGAVPSASHAGEPVPVYLGGPQVVAFYSVKGGVGRTTLVTEVACLLAKIGRYRAAPQGRAGRLRVVLADFDCGSANVSVRLGLTHPTVIDYLADCDAGVTSLGEYLVRHEPTQLDVLLGSPKSLRAAGNQAFTASHALRILDGLRSEGYHFVFVDLSSSVGPLEGAVLQAVDRVFCVVTPAASAVQDLYRTVEILRRLGLGSRLGYVANKIRRQCDLTEPLGDLGGTLAATIPFDEAFERAENRHRPLAVSGAGESLGGLMTLATALYPAMVTSPSQVRGRFSRLTRRRHVG